MLHVHVVVVSPVPVSCGDWTVWRLFSFFMFPVGREVAWHAVKGKRMIPYGFVMLKF